MYPALTSRLETGGERSAEGKLLQVHLVIFRVSLETPFCLKTQRQYKFPIMKFDRAGPSANGEFGTDCSASSLKPGIQAQVVL